MDNFEIVKKWCKYAGDDLQVAKNLMETMHNKPLEIICYHCQQAAEKYLKAYLISKNWGLERTHDLIILLTTAVNYDSDFSNYKKHCSFMNSFGVKVRYPDEIDVLERDANYAIKFAEEIEGFVLEKLNLGE